MSIYNEKIYQLYILILLLICHIHIDEAAKTIKDTSLRHKRATRDCHRKYQTIPGHTACLPKSSKVVDTGVSDGDKRTILDLHNNARSTVNPPAEAMLKMTWDDEVAMVAQAWAENCVQNHDEWYKRLIPGRFSLGQNLAWGYGTRKMTWDIAINGWHREVDQFTYGGNNVAHAVGHYTQMVWDNSTKIGCGYAQCDNIYYFVCNYAPAGNFDINNPYRTGSSCSKCSSKCSNNLCDCGTNACLNFGVMDPDTCTCTCMNYPHYVGGNCALDCDLLSEDRNCGIYYKKNECSVYSNYPFQCPALCDVCPYGGISYNPPPGRSSSVRSNMMTICTSIFILFLLKIKHVL